VPVEALREHAQTLGYEVQRLRDRRAASEADRLAIEQQEARYREFVSAEATGLWQIRLLVGGSDERTTRRAAALLCAANDVRTLPYRLTPGERLTDLDAALALAGGDPAGFPFLGSTALLAAIARPPARELPGIRFPLVATFDLNPESNGAIRLGSVLDRGLRSAGAVQVSADTLNRHTFVCGATGAGKSQTIRNLLESLQAIGVPWLVIEPAKSEYASMAGRLAGIGTVTVIRPGEPDVIPVSMNPLEPEPGFPLQTHIDLVRALFLAAFEADEPFPQVLSHALTRCYENLGWNLVLSEPVRPDVRPKYPSLGDLQRTALHVVEQIGYGREVTDNVRGFIDVRIGSLRLGAPGRFFEGGHPLGMADLLRSSTVLELEDIGNDQDKAFFIGTVLIRIIEHLRLAHARAPRSVSLTHVTVVEEAHRLLKAATNGPAAHAVELFAGLLAEIRAYGEGVIVAEQIPSKIIPDVLKNSALKIMHRLPSYDDRFAVGATMNLDPTQSQYAVTLPPGQAIVFADGMDRPVLMEIPLGEARESAELANRMVAVSARRSAACGRACRDRACTLREMNHGQRLADDPHMTLWIELSTIAHIIGEPIPTPDPTWLDRLGAAADRRTLECAVGQLAQASVDDRYAGLAVHYAPEGLAEHVATAALRQVDGHPVTCDGTETGWQAGRYRWIDVFRALHDGSAKDRRHPDDETWRRRGLDLPGRTQPEQLNSWRRHPDNWRPAPATVEGVGVPPAFERAAARLSNAPDPVDRLREAAGFLRTATDWPAARLYRQAGEKRRSTDD
jgi:hypothetical protein